MPAKSLPLSVASGNGVRRGEALPLPLARGPGDDSPPMVCRMVFDELCVLANGDIVCSCGDPAGMRVYGNVFHDRIADLYNGSMYRDIRAWQLRSRPDSWCPVIGTPCGGRVSRATAVDGVRERTVKMLQLEVTSACNLRCPECPVTHFKLNPAYRENRPNSLPLAVMLDVVDQLPDLEKLLFYNFGEPFLHKDAITFLREVRRRRPDVQLHTNTNGTVLRPEQIQALASERLLDHIVFSIDGAAQASYRRYRVGGDITKALHNLESFVRACEAAGTRELVTIFWQYILFEWNDSDAELTQAMQKAQSIGVPIKWVVTHTVGASRRFVDGSVALARLTDPDRVDEMMTCMLRLADQQKNNGIFRGRYWARLTTDRAQFVMRPGDMLSLNVVVENRTAFAWRKDRGRGFRLGVRLRSANGSILSEYPAVQLPASAVIPGGRGIAYFELPVPEQSGRYQVLFDVVEDDVCYFSERGSQPLVCLLDVQPSHAT
jgi:molybdenum cofactor biosynthesis enzyme MoaA